jgi:hypothetical protein
VEEEFCRGCGRPQVECADGAHPCGRGGADDPLRFCPRCGWRLRTIAVVPGTTDLWCRTHGLLADE